MFFNRIKRLVKWVEKSPTITGFIYPSLTVVPPLLVAFTKSDGTKPEWLCAPVRIWFDQHPTWVGITVIWPFVFILLGYLFLLLKKYTSSDEVTAEHMVLILNAFDNAVGKKVTRFGKLLTAHTEKKNNPPKLIDILDPDNQIEALIDMVYILFKKEASPDDEGLVVVLANMGRKHIESFKYFVPQDLGPRASVESLKSPDCTFSVARKTESIVIVEDIQKELKRSQNKRYAVGNHSSGDTGSIICFPIMHPETKDYPYAISIKSIVPKTFTLKNKKRYENLLNRIAKRINMEYSIKLILEKEKE